MLYLFNFRISSKLEKISAPDHLTNANHLDHILTMQELKDGEHANKKITQLLDEKALISMRIKKNR